MISKLSVVGRSLTMSFANSHPEKIEKCTSEGEIRGGGTRGIN